MNTRSSAPRRSNTAADLAFVAVFTALVIALGFVAIPAGALGVPILLQNTAIIVAALVLGPRRGFLVAALFIAIGLILPVLAGGRTTLAALASPTAGYLLSYLVAAPTAGAIARGVVGKPKAATVAVFALAGYLGLLIQYVCGAAGMMLRANLSPLAALQAQLPFIPTDAIEMAVMVSIAAGVHAAFPHLLRGGTSR